MGMRFAIVIAVENYADSRIPSVQYAEADAQGFAAALGATGALDVVALLSATATNTTIQSQVKQKLKFLAADDQLYIFYAGHGFSRNGHNYITCRDTNMDDLEGTSIKLKELLDSCGKSACRKITLFLDSCESGITDIPEVRGIYSTMSEAELEEFFRDAEYRTCFTSCKTTEESWSTGHLKHGIWSYHVIEALEGNAPKALEEGRYVTAWSLQNYLAAEVPRTLRKVRSKPTVQTPWIYGSQSRDFVIADLDEILQKRAAVKPGYDQVKQVFLRSEESVKVASLSGFKKGSHQVPKYHSGATAAFVEKISQGEIDEEVESVFDRIKAHMKYKRKDVDSAAGRIITPDFEFFVESAQDSDDPSVAIISRQLINITPKIISDDGFNAVFAGSFVDLTLEFNTKIDLKDLIDQIEDRAADGIDIDYPADCSHCELTVSGSEVEIRVTANSLTIHAPQASSPKELMEAFFDVQTALAASPVAKALAPAPTK